MNDVTFDPFEDGFRESPYEQYARLRAADPVHHSEVLHGWVLTRYADVDALLRDPHMSSEPANAVGNPVIDAEIERIGSGGSGATSLVLCDDPDHNRLRRLMQAPFGPRAIAGLRDLVRARVDEALDALADSPTVDVVSDFAYPLPVSVFCELLGIPAEDSPQFRVWTQAVARNLDPFLEDDERQRNRALHDEMHEYLAGLVEEKGRNPGEDVLTVLVHAEDDGGRLTREELVFQLLTLYVAGHEPVTALVGNGLLALMRHPDELARLRADLSLLPGAVTELLRYDGPNQFVRRIALQPHTIGDRTIGAGEVIYAGVAAANRDPAKWGDDADVLRIDRPDAVSHLQFGTGIHSCLGSHLARLQAEAMLAGILTRWSHVELAADPVWSPRMVLRSVDQLVVTFQS